MWRRTDGWLGRQPLFSSRSSGRCGGSEIRPHRATGHWHGGHQLASEPAAPEQPCGPGRGCDNLVRGRRSSVRSCPVGQSVPCTPFRPVSECVGCTPAGPEVSRGNLPCGFEGFPARRPRPGVIRFQPGAVTAGSLEVHRTNFQDLSRGGGVGTNPGTSVASLVVNAGACGPESDPGGGSSAEPYFRTPARVLPGLPDRRRLGPQEDMQCGK
jgi:hypothetical protein